MKFIGYVSYMKELFVKKKESQHFGKNFYLVYFEDESFTANFMLWPGDPRFRQLEKTFKMSLKERMPIILTLEKNPDYDPSYGTGKRSANIPRNVAAAEMCKTFKIKEK